jgi:hypothetical protein
VVFGVPESKPHLGLAVGVGDVAVLVVAFEVGRRRVEEQQVRPKVEQVGRGDRGPIGHHPWYRATGMSRNAGRGAVKLS